MHTENHLLDLAFTIISHQPIQWRVVPILSQAYTVDGAGVTQSV
jgi:hypothetical protein